MKAKTTAILLCASLLSVGCASVNTSPNVYRAGQALQNHNSRVVEGVVASVRDVQIAHQSTLAGPAIGAAVGVGLGSLIGGGSGKRISQGLGALLLGSVGERVEENLRVEVGQEIIVRYPNGKLKAFVQAKDRPIVPGQRVMVVGLGREARVVGAAF